MGLDLYLHGEEKNACPHCGTKIEELVPYQVFHKHLTHNLIEMASEAGIYHILWEPEFLKITKAGQLIDALSKGLDLLLIDPERFKRFNPKNGWGSYYVLVNVVRAYLQACQDNPDAIILADR